MSVRLPMAFIHPCPIELLPTRPHRSEHELWQVWGGDLYVRDLVQGQSALLIWAGGGDDVCRPMIITMGALLRIGQCF